MTEQTTVAQSNNTQTEASPAPAQPKPKQPRQLVRFTFYKLDPQWQRLPADVREQGKQQLQQIYEQHSEKALVRSFGLYGVRSDCDFMIWQATYDIEDLRTLSS